MDEKEKKIQEAIENSKHLWDKKFKQEDWNSITIGSDKPIKARRVKGRFASKALSRM